MLELYKYSKSEQDKLLKNIVILVDTREHENKNDHILNFFDSNGIAWENKKLNYGDYSFKVLQNEELNIPRDLDFSSQIVVERKHNLEELSGNLTSQSERSRIKKELALAPKHKVMVVENASYASMVNGEYNTKYAPKSFWASYHSIWHEFDIPIVFMPDQRYTGIFINGYFTYYLRDLLK